MPTGNLPDIKIISSCTGNKCLKGDLTENQLRSFLKTGCFSDELATIKASELYTGMQHRYLMQGISYYRKCGGKIRLKIVSAGLGLVDENDKIPPYDYTFSGKSAKKILQKGIELGIPEKISEFLSEPSELTVFLLGNSYLTAANLNQVLPDGRYVFLAAPSGKLPPGVLHLKLGMDEARRFGATLVSLKGYLVKILLKKMCEMPEQTMEIFTSGNPQASLAFLEDK
ncbi:MAG: hypothetical protein JXR95_04150 [Deltaproteobacteria bacterium]|nr:hypothetical protein [Deltaproteobacteria bacterium]